MQRSPLWYKLLPMWFIIIAGKDGVVFSCLKREFEQVATATAKGTLLKKRFDEQYNDSACSMFIFVLHVLSCPQQNKNVNAAVFPIHRNRKRDLLEIIAILN